MRPLPSSFALLVTGAALLLPGCRSGFRPNFEAEVSLATDPTAESPSEARLADELRARAELLSLQARVDVGLDYDGILTIKLKAKDKEEALNHLDALCQSGTLSIRAVHDQSVFLSAAVRSDPAKLPADHEIMTYSLEVEDLARSENLVVQQAEIVGSRQVKRAEAERGTDHKVHISLTVKGGQEMMAATKKMQKGRSRLAIIYDDRIISAPVVVDVLASEITLEGFNSFEEAQAVAASLSKPLSSKLLIESLKPLAR